MTYRRRQFVKTAGAASVVALAGCSSGNGDGTDGSDGPATTGTASGGNELETVTWAHVPTIAMAPAFIADDEGYFEERGIDVEFTREVSGARAVSQLATGDLDLAQGAVGASTFNSIAQGLPVQVVADSERAVPDIPAVTRIWVHGDHYEEGMTLNDLPDGFTWAINTEGSVNEYIVGRELQAHGLTWDDIEVTAMPFPDMVAAFASDSIDVACMADPLGPQAREEAGARLFGQVTEVAPELQIAGLLYGEPFRESRPNVARGMLEAWVEGIRQYYELTLYDDQVVSLINEYLDIPEPAVRSAVPNFHHKNGFAREESIMNQQEFHSCRGNMIQDPVGADEIIDHSILESALDEIGRVENPNPTVEEFQGWEQAAAVDFQPLGEARSPQDFPSSSICQ